MPGYPAGRWPVHDLDSSVVTSAEVGLRPCGVRPAWLLWSMSEARLTKRGQNQRDTRVFQGKKGKAWHPTPGAVAAGHCEALRVTVALPWS